jgi:peptidoglycan hydrolase-like protein with peptidoglycan-binding domain
MSKRNRIILMVSIIAIVLVALSLYAYISAKRASPGAPVTLRQFFTFGTSAPIVSPTGITPTGSPTPVINTAPKEKSPIMQISTRPIAGAAALMFERTAQGAVVPAATAPALEWSRNLAQGDTGQDVKELQQFLNLDLKPAGGTSDISTVIAKSGPGSPGQETMTFGPATKQAVMNFQQEFAADILTPSGLTAGTGIVDEPTRAKIHALKGTIPAKESALAVRYVDRASGNIYQTFIDTIAEKQISSTTIPKIQEAFFGANNGVLLRFLAGDNSTITTFSGTLPAIVAGGDSALSLQGGFLEPGIKTLSLSPDGSRFFYLTNTEQSAFGTTAAIDGSKRNQLWTSAYTEWLPQWVNDRVIALTTKPSSTVPGYLYSFDTQTKNFTKVIGNIKGLTTLYSPNGKKILYSRTSTNGNGIILGLYDLDTKLSNDIGINTFPEKCIWTPDSITLYCAVPAAIPPGQYPDVWYQGAITFGDTFWKLDTKTSLFKQIADPASDADATIDGINLFLDQRETRLFFTNKNDSTLWAITL